MMKEDYSMAITIAVWKNCDWKTASPSEIFCGFFGDSSTALARMTAV